MVGSGATFAQVSLTILSLLSNSANQCLHGRWKCHSDRSLTNSGASVEKSPTSDHSPETISAGEIKEEFMI